MWTYYDNKYDPLGAVTKLLALESQVVRSFPTREKYLYEPQITVSDLRSLRLSVWHFMYVKRIYKSRYFYLTIGAVF